MWEGRFSKSPDKKLNDFNSSIRVDGRMYESDIEGSIAHAEMLAECGIISSEDRDVIIEGLKEILADIESGKVKIDPESEDIHMFVEALLTERKGEAGKKLHTARSRNDQVATDVRLHLRKEIDRTEKNIIDFMKVIVDKAEEYADAVMPGYTHLQRAQPVTFGHHLLAYAEMLKRDVGRFADSAKRMNYSPLGSCALAGTTHPINRAFTAAELNFDGYCSNSIDGVSDRDFCLEIASACSICMTHLSRFAEEIILWCSWEFKFLELDDAYATGSSIMPQKKNPDIAELIRGKTGRVNGNLVALLTLMKGLPLAYNKDMQEDKEAIFDSLDTLNDCLEIFAPMLATSKARKDNMLRACREGFINATDCADYLVRKGVPFRTAYKICGRIVAYCIERGKTLENLSVEEYASFDPIFDEEVYEAVDMLNCVSRRKSSGAPSEKEVKGEIASLKAFIDKFSVKKENGLI